MKTILTSICCFAIGAVAMGQTIEKEVAKAMAQCGKVLPPGLKFANITNK